MSQDIRKALVIGSEGNIGSRLTEYLRSSGYEVLDVDIEPRWRPEFIMGDITHPLDLLPAFDWGPDVVFLCAALVGRMTSEQAASLAITTNLGGVNNVLQLCKRTNSMCIFFSTSEVYGPSSHTMDEEKAELKPGNRYGLTKWLGEQLVEYEVRTHGLRAVTLRPCMFYDELETVGEHRSAMIRFASNLARGRPITVHRGSARSWLHISDAVQAIERATRVQSYTAINIGHPDVLPMRDVAEMARVELDADPSLIREAELPPGMTLVKQPVLQKQGTLLDFQPSVSIQEGIRRVCEVQKQLAADEARFVSPLGNGQARRFDESVASAARKSPEAATL